MLEKYQIEDLKAENQTAFNYSSLIDWKSFNIDEFHSLTITREYQNLNNNFRSCLNPIDILKQEKGRTHIKNFLNVRKNIYKNNDNEYYNNASFWLFSFNFSIFKGRGTDLYFIKISFKKERDFLRFFALMGFIKGNLTYKGEFTRKERKLLYKLKNPVKSNYIDIEELRINLYYLKKERENLKESYRLLKGLNKNLSKNFNKWGSWSCVPRATQKRFKELNLLKRDLKRNRFKINKLKSIIFDVEDDLLNTSKLWED